VCFLLLITLSIFVKVQHYKSSFCPVLFAVSPLFKAADMIIFANKFVKQFFEVTEKRLRCFLSINKYFKHVPNVLGVNPTKLGFSLFSNFLLLSFLTLYRNYCKMAKIIIEKCNKCQFYEETKFDWIES
jgi:hypothetical protein